MSYNVDPAMFGARPDFLLKVRGWSMRDAGIMDGDFLAVKKVDSAKNGQIVVALVDDSEVTLKRLRRQGASTVLEPCNQTHQPQTYPAHMVKVQGRLVGLLRRY